MLKTTNHEHNLAKPYIEDRVYLNSLGDFPACVYFKVKTWKANFGAVPVDCSSAFALM